jgi:hypothetical protein
MRHWLFVTRPWNLRICESTGLFGLDNRYRTTAQRYIRPGDLAAVYVAGVGIVGVVKVTDVALDEEEGTLAGSEV